jgi:hypothetical protein
MKNLLVLALVACASCHHPTYAADPVKAAGKWELVLTAPHRSISGTLDLKQDGAKLSGTWATDHVGAIPITGSIDGKNVSLAMEVHGMAVKLLGTVDGSKMFGKIDPDMGTWAATREAAAAAARTILGSVASIDAATLQFTINPDSGTPQRFRVGAETQVVQVAPGEQDLTRGKAARLTDVAKGDRVLVSFVEGLPEARRIVLVSADDITKRNEAEKLDWQKRGISGIVAGKTAEEVILETRTLLGVVKTTVVIGGKTKIRQYAPDSVSFAAARPAKLEAVAVGDQFKVRGERNGDGTRLMAEDAVFGTFLTKIGTVLSVDADARVVRINDIATKTPLTVKISGESRMKTMAAGRPQAQGHGQEPSSAADITQMLLRMPDGKLEDLKPGASVLVTATRGSRPDEVTAILLLANIDGIIQMAQAQAGKDGVSVMDAMAGLHGGIFAGPTGLALPAILQ